MQKTKSVSKLLAAVAIVLLMFTMLPASAWAAAEVASYTIKVHGDGEPRNVPGAVVTLEAAGLNPVEATTDGNGEAVLMVTASDSYTLTIVALGYTTLRLENYKPGNGTNVVDIYADAVPPVIHNVTVSPDEGWTAGPVTVTVEATDNKGIDSYSFDAGLTWQPEETLEVEVNCTFPFGAILVKDTAGNITTWTGVVVISNIVTAPKIISVTVSPDTDATKEEMIVQIDAQSNRGDDARLEYSFDGENWGPDPFKAYSDNITLSGTISVRDNFDGEFICSDIWPNAVLVNKINKLAPSVNVNYDDQPTSGSVKITVTATLNRSSGYQGSEDLFYSYNGEPSNADIESEYIAYKNGPVTIKVQDAAGNESTTTVNITNIDQEGPSIVPVKVTNSEGQEDGWDALVNYVYFSASDENGVANVRVQTTDGRDVNVTPDGGNYRFAANENGTYYLFAVDGLGNTSGPVEVVVNKIDTTAPQITATLKNPAEEWHNGAVQVSVTAADSQTSGDPNGSGVKQVVYSIVYSDYTAALANGTLQNAVFDPASGTYRFSTLDQAFVGNYTVWAIDNVGRVSAATPVSIKIDKEAPVNVTVSYVNPDKGFIGEILNILTFGLLYKDNVTIKIGAQDSGSGIAKYQYQLVATGTDVSDTAWKDINDTSDSAEFAVPYQAFEGKLYIRVWDRAGNFTDAVTDCEGGTTIIIDKEAAAAPTVALNGTLAENWTGAWINSDVVITLSGSEPVSGVDYYQYRIDNGDWTTMPDTDGTLSRIRLQDKADEAVPNKITVSGDTNAKYYFRAVSNTGVAGAETAAISIRIQKSTPANASCSLAPVNGDNGWYVGSLGAPDLIITQPAADADAAPIHTYYKLWCASRGETESGATEKLFSGTQPAFTADGVYVLKIWTVDEAGNRCDDDKVITKEIKIATAAPSGLAITTAEGRPLEAGDPECVVFRIFSNTSIRINLSANFGVSGQGSLSYQKVRNATFYNPNGDWTAYNPATGIQADPSDKFVIYFRAVDMAGNVSTIIHTDGIILDGQAPEGEFGAPDLTVVPQNPNANGFFNSDVAVNIVARDPRYLGSVPDEVNGVCSALYSVTYRVFADGVVTKETTVLFRFTGSEIYNSGGSYTPNEDDGLVERWSGSILVSAADNNSNNVVVEVTAVDNAGNSRTTSTAPGAIKIDSTKPTIDISYDNNHGDTKSGGEAYFNADRIATITITERNFRAEDAIIVITKDGVRANWVGDWQMINPGTGNGDDRTHQAQILYHADGDYTFSVEYTDMAGNESDGPVYAAGTVASERFVIDQTPPQITVTYNNNAAQNGKYFNQRRTATITVVEHNFDPNRVNITRTASLNGAPLHLQTASDWTSQGNDIYTIVLENTMDGDYVFDISMEDMAGNRNGPVKYAGSAAPNEFTIDTKFETLNITGVENGKFYNGKVAPSIFFEDLNFDRYEITLTRTKWGAKDVDVTTELIPRVNVNDKGGSVTINTLEKIQENDGIYTLSVKVYDKAGNTKTAVVNFTINRFGSLYVFNDALVALQDGYVKAVDQPLVITEYNPTRLVEGSLNLEITRDGVPLSDVKYTVDPEISDTVSVGSSGWYEYHYTIDPSNFADANGNSVDGIYRIVAASKDEADNAPETTNYSDKIILFRIDNVAPEIASITGLGKRVVNQSSLKVEFEIFDALGLEKITVFVNDSVIKTFDSFEGTGSFAGSFTVGEGLNQKIRIRVEDKAGNVTDTDDQNFKPAFPFERSVTVSTNFLVRWFANTPVFIGSILSPVILGGAIWFTVVARKTRKFFG